MKTIGIFGFFLITLFMGCYTPLKPATIIENGTIHNYKYIFITPTNSLTSGSGITYGQQYYSTTKTVNPGDVINGILSKESFIRLSELKPDLYDQTLII